VLAEQRERDATSQPFSRDGEDGEEADGGGGSTKDANEETAAGQLAFEGGGILSRVFKRVFNVVDRPWKMLPLGMLFGLGFDTSSEIALLGIASLQGAQGTSIWLIMIFPVLFTGQLLHFLFFTVSLCENDDALRLNC